MEFDDIQGICLVYGTKENIEAFLEANQQRVEEADSPIAIMEVKPNSEWFKDIRKQIWKGD